MAIVMQLVVYLQAHMLPALTDFLSLTVFMFISRILFGQAFDIKEI